MRYHLSMARGDGQDPKKPADDGNDASFDAVAAAQELDDVLASAAGAAVGNDDYIRSLERDIEELNALVAQKDARIRSIEERMDDALEDIERAKDRVERESDKVLEAKTKKLLLGFIDVLDDLERAIEAAQSTDHNPAVVEGVVVVRTTFLARLSQFGVSRKDSLGEPFDPTMHDAVSLVPVDDPSQHNLVVGVAQEAYLLRDAVLRPARVAVGKHN
jgi:molecular chaperone GrpE